jgi:NAD(P)H dehydrogenase (quinone)
MSNIIKPRILITGATGPVGGKTIDFLLSDTSIEIVAAVCTPENAVPFTQRGMETVILDFDDESTHIPAFKNIDRVFMVAAYTVDMLRQSKALLDNAKKAGVKHIVHLGACGPDDTSIGHWAWHQFVERYIERAGFSYTHLRHQDFMQNLLGYGAKKAIKNGVLNHYAADARKSWVDVDNVAEVAAGTSRITCWKNIQTWL